MAAALRRFIDSKEIGKVVLIGYSGGGVLAWLLAERIEEVRALVTVAANLDIDAWAKRHSYSKLGESLNPAGRGPLPRHVVQLHLAGSRDTNVPPSLIRAALRAVDAETRLRVLGASHGCCWESLWPQVLEAVERLDDRGT